ncbi:MAG TPA: terminase TerL endonuclease subunit [Burkholderiaceae bacterium]|nr:terminase TerL endonuclease subunit [Burkholderiaceae bacterium]
MLDLTEAAARGWVFDTERVQRVLDFFADVLRLSSGEFEGTPFVLKPWQVFIVGSIFGWVNAQGQRRFRVVFVETGKGSGKSPLAAGIGLYMLIADGEARAEVYAAASKKDQAMVLFRDAVAMVDMSPGLKERVHQTGGATVWNMSYRGSFFRAIASDDGQSGPRPHCGLIDEVHEHKDDTVIEMMRAGFKARRSPLLFMITNSGVDRQSVCWRYHDKAVKVAEQAIADDRFFSYVCALDKDEDPLTDPACWPKTNPNLGVSIPADYLEDQVREALQMPSKESIVRRLNFCQWVDATSPWISGDAWRRCEVEHAEPFTERFAGARVTLAVDLSTTTDLTALAMLVEIDDRLFGAVEFWTPLDTLRSRGERDGVDYALWVAQGHVHALPGSTLEYGPIAQRIAELAEIFDVVELVFDRYRMTYLRRELEQLGVAITLTEHPQTFVKPAKSPLWMPQSINEIEGAIMRGELEIDHNPCLTWAAASAVCEVDLHQSRIFSKRKATGRIDGLVALTMSIGARRAPRVVLDVGAMVA